MPSEQQSSKTPLKERDQWRTPPWLFAFLQDRYGRFQVDLCASECNALCLDYITVEQDALLTQWFKMGSSGFMNPPYSAPLPFVRKAIAEAERGFSVTIVLPTHRNQKWAALAQYATERIEFEGRVNFNRPDGSPGATALGGTQVLYFRRHDLGSTRTTWVRTKEIMTRFGVG